MNKKNTKSRSLKRRILLTFTLLTIIRIGSFIPLPYIDRQTYLSLLQSETSSTNAVAQIINSFSGGDPTSFGILSLGILPYINASIIIQLLTTLIPSLAKMQKEEGEYGRRKITDATRILTFIWAIIESIGITYSFKGLIFNWSFWTAAQISITLITGSMIILWFSELITSHGLGNGSSLLICFNIIASLPDQIKTLSFSLKNQPNGLDQALLLVIIFLITTGSCIWINEAVIKIPLVSARQLQRTKTQTSNKSSKTTSLLPLRLNQAGVMPLVFTSYAVVVCSSFVGFLKNKFISIAFINTIPFLNNIVFYWLGKGVFWAFYAGLIFFFTYFYSTIVLDPEDLAERFRKDSVIILGVPTKDTKSYLNKTLRRIASINAFFLIINIVALQLIESFFHINISSLRGLGFTSQLILVNVLIDTLKRMKSFLNEDKTSL